jgi:DNA polymerase-3 subunit beta
MKFIINRDILVDSLQKVLGPTTTKQNYPTLTNVLLKSTEDRIKLVTTDLDMTIIAFQKADVSERGEIVVPMKRFLSIIRELPPENIAIEKTKNNLSIRCEQVEFKINTLPVEEFPKIQEERGASLIKIDPQVLEQMIRLTSFCVGYEDSNYVLSGILFEIDENKINLVSTDGKRLAVIQKLLLPNQPEIKTKITFILPIKAITELSKLLKEREGEIYLYVEENKVGFDFKDMQFVARPIEGEFPAYAQYIPSEGKDKLVADRKKLLFAIKRAGLLATSDSQGVKFELKKDSLTVYKNTPQLGEVKEAISVQYGGVHLELGFNPNYLIDALKNLEDEQVSIWLYGADKPAVLKREDYIYLLLPMKI